MDFSHFSHDRMVFEHSIVGSIVEFYTVMYDWHERSDFWKIEKASLEMKSVFCEIVKSKTFKNF